MVQFQMPQFVLSAGPPSWSDYDKYSSSASSYDHPGPSKYYSLADLVADPNSRPTQTPKPFEFHDSPYPHHASVPSSPEQFLHPIPYPQHTIAAPLAQYPLTNYSVAALNSLDPTTPLPPIPPNGLSLYSASGFDMLKMLGKVATRPNPKIMLGPVDMTCSFVVVDVRRFDSPVVYASPTFTRLTGYSESEVLGRNCRFLQAPSGQVQRAEERRYTAPDAVRHLQKCLLQEKECQASLINYRKDGGAFINLVTVIPIAAEDGSDEITHHVGFQVDLAEQPNAILQKLRDGSYIVNYSNSTSAAGYTGSFGFQRDVRRGRGVSQDMTALLRAEKTWPLGGESAAKPVRDHERAELHAMLLENTDDFIHVVSLKGALLYVAPAVRRVLDYDPAELIGKSIGDLCHPSDYVPLMRELKDASSSSSSSTPAAAAPATVPTEESPLFVLPQQQPSAPPKPINLLFRVRHKTQSYVWIEARGRLHVEQGKGRKAVVLVGRRMHVPSLPWAAVPQCKRERDCWGLVAPNGLVLSASGVGAAKLGYGEDGAALIGRSLASLVKPEEARRVGEVLGSAACAQRHETRTVRCEMVGRVSAEITFHAGRGAAPPALPPSLVFRIRFLEDAADVVEEKAAARTSPDADVLEELDTARETCWQYELKRLHSENQRMRDEVGALERMQSQMPYLRRHMDVAPVPVMASLGAGSVLLPAKRMRDDEAKLPSPT